MSQSEKLDWRDVRADKECLICRQYGEGTEQYEALKDYLDTPRPERHGVRWHTFVTLFLRDKLRSKGAASTWARHVDLCLERRADR